MIASTSEAQCGIENLWQRGRSNGRRDCVNFSRLTCRNYFKFFFQLLLISLVIKSSCVLIKEGKWDIFLPYLNKHDERRRKLMTSVLLALKN